jgi:hypothetical protein
VGRASEGTWLRRIADKDQEQEVLGMAVPVVDVAIREAVSISPKATP